MTVGQTTAAALLFHRLFSPISELLFTFDEAQDAGASLARLVGLVDHAGRTGAPRTQPAREPRDASLDLEDLHFSYDGEHPVVHGVSLRLEPGERVALVGSTGAGKSTVAGIAAGALTPQRGAARIGGVDVAESDRRAAPQARRDRQPGGARLRGAARRRSAPGQAGRHRRRGARRAARRSAPTSGSRRSTTVSTRSSAKAATS